MAAFSHYDKIDRSWQRGDDLVRSTEMTKRADYCSRRWSIARFSVEIFARAL
jgi:hypothetical protein